MKFFRKLSKSISKWVLPLYLAYQTIFGFSGKNFAQDNYSHRVENYKKIEKQFLDSIFLGTTGAIALSYANKGDEPLKYVSYGLIGLSVYNLGKGIYDILNRGEELKKPYPYNLEELLSSDSFVRQISFSNALTDLLASGFLGWGTYNFISQKDTVAAIFSGSLATYFLLNAIKNTKEVLNPTISMDIEGYVDEKNLEIEKRNNIRNYLNAVFDEREREKREITNKKINEAGNDFLKYSLVALISTGVGIGAGIISNNNPNNDFWKGVSNTGYIGGIILGLGAGKRGYDYFVLRINE